MVHQPDHVTLFAETNFRNQRRRFGIKLDDRRRHMYLIGKTGMGKTTMLEQLIFDDINNGHGVGVVDPHGDLAEKILDYIPTSRINDVIYFNPSDVDYPIGFNVLETIDPRHKHLVASGLMGVFKKIWPDVWSPRMEYILNNCILALLDYPGSTLLGINRLLVDKEFRRRVVSHIENPVVKTFWTDEYARYSEKFATEAIAPIQNKVGQFLSASIIRNIVAQVKSTINIREIMDTHKIFIMNLSKGRIGEDSSRLLGGMLITKVQLAAMERVDIPEKERQDFFLYVDEFQNFSTESFANILSEARKYRLDLVMAHQYIEQLDENVRPAVFGNVGTIIVFRVGAEDAEFLEKEFAPEFTAEDLVNLAKYNVYLKLMIDGVASNPFSAQTFLTEYKPVAGNREKVIRISRERYSEPRETIEEKIMRWSGMAGGEEPLAEAVPVAGGEEGSAGAPSGQIAQKEQRHIYLHEEEIETGTHSRRVDEGLAQKQKPKSAGSDGKRYEAICSRCGKATDVPFVPDASRPIFCVDCYAIVNEEKRRQQKSGAAATPAPPYASAKLSSMGSAQSAHARTPPHDRMRATPPVASAPPPPKPISLKDAWNASPPPSPRSIPKKHHEDAPAATYAPAKHPLAGANAPKTQDAKDATRVKQGEIVIFDDV